MKSKDLQQLVLSKHESGDTIAKIYRDLNGAISYDTVRRWCNMIGRPVLFNYLLHQVLHVLFVQNK